MTDTFFNPVETIERRRYGRPHSDEEIEQFIDQYLKGQVKEYQMSAWLMACCFSPLTERETATLTRCVCQSGLILNWDDNNNSNSSSNDTDRPRLVDKHSSGGVGDKVSLILTPLVVAAAESAGVRVAVPMMAGRGLGHTGGTIDKLESLKGFNAANLSVEAFQNIVIGSKASGSDNETTSKPVGCAIVGQSSDLCPADKRLYALRDVTCTVSCPALMTASIMSKKIAENPDSIVLDIKYGNGAFRSNVNEALELADGMVAVGEANGLNPTTALLTKMDHPIGSAVGNWLEVRECIHIMIGGFANRTNDDNAKDHGDYPGGDAEFFRLCNDLIALVVIQAGQMLYQSTTQENTDSATQTEKSFPTTLDGWTKFVYGVLDSGAALTKFREMALAQEADPEYLEQALTQPYNIPLATYVATWESTETGYIWDIPAKTIGDVGVMIGAGRTETGQTVDPEAGVLLFVKVGDAIEPGKVVAKVFCNQSQSQADKALVIVQKAIRIESEPMAVTKDENDGGIVTHCVTKSGREKFAFPDYLLP